MTTEPLAKTAEEISEELTDFALDLSSESAFKYRREIGDIIRFAADMHKLAREIRAEK